MARKEELPRPQKTRRTYDEDFKREAVQMMLDGLSPSSVAKRLGLPSTNSLYNWRKRYVTESGPVAESLEARVQQLEDELRRVERERDILKKPWPFSARADSRSLRRHRADRRRASNRPQPCAKYWASAGPATMPGGGSSLRP